jgi:hypothetical protein
MTMNALAAFAHREACFVLIAINMASGKPAKDLYSRYKKMNTLIGLPNDDVFANDIFHSTNTERFEENCKDRKIRGTWIFQASESNFSKLYNMVPPEEWSNCVFIFDECHNFFTCDDNTRKLADIYVNKILFGSIEPEERRVSNMSVRAFVLTSATPGDMPHKITKDFHPEEGEFRMIVADDTRLKEQGYVSVQDARLFRDGLSKNMKSDQWYGKDVDRVSKGISGLEFANQMTLDHFDPTYRAFTDDCLAKPRSNTPSCMLEFTSVHKSEKSKNSIEHHARGIARCYPDAIALAQHGEGVFHFDQYGVRTAFADPEQANEVLTQRAEYAGSNKYIITNIGYGSMTYHLAGRPVTHIYIAFKNNVNNMLQKAQGMGRACGYIKDDLDLRLGYVQVLCTREHFEEIQTKLDRWVIILRPVDRSDNNASMS